MESFYYVIGSIIGTCSIITTLVCIMNKLYYSKTDGEILKSRLDTIIEMLEKKR